MTVARFCRKEVVTAPIRASALDVARLMKDRHVGCVVVVDEDKPIGIVTDRDLIVRLVAEKRPAGVPIGEVMTAKPVVVRDRDSIDEVVIAMKQGGVRRLPIVDSAGKLAGLVSLDDLTVLLAAELGQAIEAIRSDRGP